MGFLAMNKLKKGDKVVVISGKDKGKTGVIIESIDSGEYFLVDGLNIVTKNIKPNPSMNIQGGQTTKSMPVPRSKLLHWDETAQKPSRVGFKRLEDGSLVRFLKKSNQILDLKK